jgi:hypothetical protein
MGKKTEKDLSLCIGTFRNISKDNWIKMCNLKGNTLESGKIEKTIEIIEKPKIDIIKGSLSNEELREKRLKYYENKDKNI